MTFDDLILEELERRALRYESFMNDNPPKYFNNLNEISQCYFKDVQRYVESFKRELIVAFENIFEENPEIEKISWRMATDYNCFYRDQLSISYIENNEHKIYVNPGYEFEISDNKDKYAKIARAFNYIPEELFKKIYKNCIITFYRNGINIVEE